MTDSSNIQMVNGTKAVPAENHQVLKLPSPDRPTKVLDSQGSSEQTEQKAAEVKWGSNREEFQKLVDELNSNHQVRGTSLSFSIDDETNSLIVKVLEKGSEKIIRQLPTDEILALRRHINEFIGTLIDEKA